MATATPPGANEGIGRRLQAERVRSGFSVTAAVARLNAHLLAAAPDGPVVPEHVWRSWEYGRAAMPAAFVQMVAEVLECSPGAILGEGEAATA